MSPRPQVTDQYNYTSQLAALILRKPEVRELQHPVDLSYIPDELVASTVGKRGVDLQGDFHFRTDRRSQVVRTHCLGIGLRSPVHGLVGKGGSEGSTPRRVAVCSIQAGDPCGPPLCTDSWMAASYLSVRDSLTRSIQFAERGMGHGDGNA